MQGEQYTATVTGNRNYRVSITVRDSRVVKMSCSCPYASDGFRCKHMAAVLYQIEAEEEAEAKASEFPFQTENSGSVTDADLNSFPENYTYFDSKAMKEDMDCPEALWRTAVKMAKEKKVLMDSAHAGYTGEYSDNVREMNGDVQGHVNVGRNSYPVRLFFDRKHLTKGYCGVKGCNFYFSRGYYYGRRELCVHQWALFYHLKEFLKEHPLGDATDLHGQVFLNTIRKQQARHDIPEELSAAERLDLEPRLQADYGSWNLSFRIGGTKKYVVKNLSELAEHASNHELMAFGTSTRWKVSPECFTERGRQYLQFIQETVESERQRALQLSSSYDDFQINQLKIKGSIPLFGRYLDDFFELQEPWKLEFIIKEDGKKKADFLTLAHKNPRLSFTLEKSEDDKGFFQGVRISGTIPEIIRGQKGAYYIESGYLCQIDADCAARIDPLISLERNGRLDFSIGRNHLRDFYYTVLPWLRKQAEIHEKDTECIKSYLPPEARFIFYLDYEDSDMICRAEVSYGEQTASVMDVLQPDCPPTLLIGETARDMEKEKSIARLVLQFFPQIQIRQQQVSFCCGGDEELMYQVLNEGIDRMASLGEIQATDRFRRLNLRQRPKFSIGVSVDSQLLNLSVSSDQIPQDELLAILGSYKKKKNYHRLKNGDFLNLKNAESIELLEQLMTSLNVSPREFASGKMQVPAYRALYLDKMLEKNDSFYTRRDRHFKSLVKDFKTIEEADFEVPEPLRHVLRPYQTVGYQWLKTLAAYGFGGILADEMGLGKTLQVIAVLLSEKEALAAAPALIACPASLVYNWAEEFRRFAPQLKVCLIIGSQAERAQLLSHCQEANVLVTSYDLLKRDIAEYEDLAFSYEIIDEAQYIKNHSTAASKAVKAIRSRIRYALTGTPIENRLSELWSIFDYLMPGFLYSYESFRKELETPIVKNSDAAASGRLKKMVSPFILRRLKADVLKELPEKLEEIHYAGFGETQQKLYDAQVLHMKQMLESENEDDFRKHKIQVLAELTRLRQICCDPSLCYENYKDASAKREACMELIRSAIEGEHKILVFSQFTSMLELLEKDLDAAEIPYYKITGSTPKDERLALVNAFNADRTPVFLVSLKAGGTGLNLTGADVVIHYDPWWNLAAQNQATDRAHRIGQKKVVTVLKLIAKDSIEENILRTQEQKKDLADAILDGETGGIGKLSREELMELIGG